MKLWNLQIYIDSSLGERKYIDVEFHKEITYPQFTQKEKKKQHK